MSEEQQQDPVFGRKTKGNASDSINGEYEYILFGLTVFRRSFKRKKPDLDPLDIIRQLLDDFEHQESIDKSKSVASLHRVIENTHARRRLEKWSLHVIAAYLFIVLGIVLTTYSKIPFLGLPWFDIEPKIMIAILTTTTANIIGLGLIVLRGHFLAKESDKGNKEENK